MPNYFDLSLFEPLPEGRRLVETRVIASLKENKKKPTIDLEGLKKRAKERREKEKLKAREGLQAFNPSVEEHHRRLIG